MNSSDTNDAQILAFTDCCIFVYSTYRTHSSKSISRSHCYEYDILSLSAWKCSCSALLASWRNYLFLWISFKRAFYKSQSTSVLSQQNDVFTSDGKKSYIYHWNKWRTFKWVSDTCITYPHCVLCAVCIALHRNFISVFLFTFIHHVMSSFCPFQVQYIVYFHTISIWSSQTIANVVLATSELKANSSKSFTIRSECI